MNDTDKPPSSAQPPAVYSSNTAKLILDPTSIESMIRVGELMASSKIQLPKHFQGNSADCLAVVMQAMQWGLNPFTVAQKTFITPGGQLGYEAQLINAVCCSSGAFTEEPDFEFIGDWDKILGKVKEMVSKKGGGKYYVADWNTSDEAKLGVICTIRLRGKSQPKTMRLMMSQCWPRFSTLWAMDPQQQICYAVVKKFARRYTPGAILGVYTEDEVHNEAPPERDITPKVEPEPEVVSLPIYTNDHFEHNKEKWVMVISSGKKTVEDVINTICSKFELPAEQRTQIESLMVFEPKQQTDDEFMDQLGDVETNENTES